MNSRPHLQPFLSNSLAIRQEIQRFESVHPSIYAIYDLIDVIPDPLLAQQLREHVVCIEDSFVNSQEWTLSRSVPDLRLGIVGSLASGKSALVHRYLTGSYMQEESPEGGRFKKEIIIDGQSYLLLIRDEGGPPELQFTSWVDAVIFVFSLENESSFNAIYSYYAKMAHYRATADIPLILVGTQDAISENNPRVIDDARARKLASDLKRCSYYETCATYGLNVERVFQDACQKIVQQRMAALTPTNSRPSTPNHSLRCNYFVSSPTNNGFTSHSTTTTSPANLVTASPSHNLHNVQAQPQVAFKDQIIKEPIKEVKVVEKVDRSSPAVSVGLNSGVWSGASTGSSTSGGGCGTSGSSGGGGGVGAGGFSSSSSLGPTPSISVNMVNDKQSLPPVSFDSLPPPKEQKDLPTPSSTPTTSRKARRRSNLFTVSSLPSKKAEDNKKVKNGEMGSGRVIPLKQGYLYKRSCKALNKDWKKKYVALCEDGRLTYHPNLNDYMDDIHGKEIPLMHTTVKIPGQKPRGTKTQSTPASHSVNGLDRELSSLSIGGGFHFNLPALGKDKSRDKEVLLTTYEINRDGHSLGPGYVSSACDDAVVITNSGVLNGSEGTQSNNPAISKIETPNVKKRHRRMKSSGTKNLDNMDDSDGYEFIIVSLDNKQWHFDASSSEERDSWVQAIEQQILNSLQSNESSKSKSRTNSTVDAAAIQAIKTNVRGNTHCVDCDSSNPDWASLNLGALVCIECSGIHRNLGSHISRVRSLDLDEWPPWHIKVMTSIGNQMANSIWEGNVKGLAKPTPNSSREEKERWIRAKYEHKDFLLPVTVNLPLGQQLIESIRKGDMRSLVLILAHASPEQVNVIVNPRDLTTPLHMAAAMNNLAAAQLLIWHNANVKAVDHENRTALYYARNSGSQDVQELLKQSGCTEPIAPVSGTLPRRKGSITRKNPEVFDKLPASVI